MQQSKRTLGCGMTVDDAAALQAVDESAGHVEMLDFVGKEVAWIRMGSPLHSVSWQLVLVVQLSKHQCSISCVPPSCNLVQRALRV